MNKQGVGLAKSTVPVEHGVVNPAYNRVKYLMEKTPDVRQMMIQIQRWTKEGKTFAEIKVLAATYIRPGLKNIYAEFKQQPDTPAIIGAPPKPNEIYGRFGRRVRVVDVGSGNGSKVLRFTSSLRMTCVDPELNMESSAAKCVKKKIEDHYHTLDKTDLKFTSFMSLCQLSPSWQNVLLQHDGLHMVPDHRYLLRVGAAKETDGKINVFAPRTVFSDFPMGDLAGYSIKPGYLILAAFAKREISIYINNEITITNYRPFIQASPVAYTDIDLGDVSYKMDGVPYELECSAGVAMLVDRAGNERKGTCTADFHFCLHVEELVNCFTLIRVKAYNSYIPPHSYDVMEHFLRKVRLKIGDKPICMPPRWGQDGRVNYWDTTGRLIQFEEKNDGLISRHEQHDYYCKFQWTIDVKPDISDKLTLKLADRGYTLDAQFEEDLYEYGMNRNGHIVTLKPIRIRTDKDVATSLETIMFLLDQKTVPEIISLS